MNLPKIYYIANAKMPTPKAHGIQIAKMAEAMIRAGADLKLVVPARHATLQSMKEFYGLGVDVPLVKISVFDTYNYGKLGFALGTLTFMTASFLYLLWKKLIGEKFIIYTIDIDQFSFVFLPLIGKRLFAEIHDAKQWSIPFRILFSKAKGIIVINKIIKKEIIETFGASTDKIIVHPNGIDLQQFDIRLPKEKARNALKMPVNKPIALYSGRFYNWKGLEIILRAAQEIDKETLIYLVGGSEDELKKISGENAIPRNIVCVGAKDYKEMPMWLAASDVLVVLGTKKNDYSYLHTSPMKLMEYMASSRPIVASRTPANLEIVGENEAVFYAPDDHRDLAEKINGILKNPEKFGHLIDGAREKVNSLSWDSRAQSVLNFIEYKTNEQRTKK